MAKSLGRKLNEKQIIDKVQSIFDNAEYIRDFEIKIEGGVTMATVVDYRVTEFFKPETEDADDSRTDRGKL